MSESYLTNIIISKHTYLHSNGVEITTGLWGNNFVPQVHLCYADIDVYFCLKEWQNVYEKFKVTRIFDFNQNVYNYDTFKLIFCIKRCPMNIVYSVFKALNKFAYCIEIRLRCLVENDYVEAMEFINKIETDLTFKV